MTRPIFARGLGTSPAGPAGPTGAAGPAGPAGANGGTDASTADNVANGTATKAALSASIARFFGADSFGGDYTTATTVDDLTPDPSALYVVTEA